MDQKGTAPLLRTAEMRTVLRRRAETGADVARREAGDQAGRVRVSGTGTGTGQWSDRAAVDIEGPPGPPLNRAVDSVERGNRG